MYPRLLLVVSHDRAFMEGATDMLLVMPFVRAFVADKRVYLLLRA